MNIFVQGPEPKWAAVPEWLLFDSSVPAGAFRLYLVLYFMGQMEGSDLIVTHPYLAQRTGAGVSTIQRHLKSLEEAGAITIVERYDGSSRIENGYKVWWTGPLGQNDTTPRSKRPDPPVKMTELSIIKDNIELPPKKRQRVPPEEAAEAYLLADSGQTWYLKGLRHSASEHPSGYFNEDGTYLVIE